MQTNNNGERKILFKRIISTISLILAVLLIGCNGKPQKPNDNTDDTSFDLDSYKAEIDKDFAKRRQHLIDYLLDLKDYGARTGFGNSSIKFFLYESTGDESYLADALEHSKKSWAAYAKHGDTFSVMQSTLHYGMFSKYYDDELLEMSKNAIINSPDYAYAPSTTNHALCCAVGAYLANQYFPGQIKTEYYGYEGPQTDDPTGEKAIRAVLEAYTTDGIYEFNSDTYFVAHLMPLYSLYKCASDKEISNKAYLILENAFFSMAPIWLEGHMAVATERTYTPYAAQNCTGQTGLLLWYYFGGPEQFPTESEMTYMEARSIAYFVASDYRPSWMATAMANDRSEPYLHTEMHRYYKDRWKTTFISYLKTQMYEDYAVFSSRIQITGKLYVDAYNSYYRHPLDWGVRWTEEDPSVKSTFSIQHVSNIDNDRNTKFGTTAYQQVLQHGNTVIGVFDLPKDHPFPGLVIYQPDTYSAVIDGSSSGEMYFHYGQIIIAYKLSVPFVMNIEDNKLRTDAITRAWFVCEVFDTDDIPAGTPEQQLNHVKSLCEAPFANVSGKLNVATTVEYTNVKGDVMSLQYSGYKRNPADVINGEKVVYDLKSAYSQSNPWVSQKYGEKTVTYRYEDYELTIDYDAGTIVETKVSTK